MEDALPPPADAPPGMSASSSSGPPLDRGPPMSAAEVATSVEAPPAPEGNYPLANMAPPLPPPEAGPNASNRPGGRLDNALARLPNAPKMPFNAPKMPERMQGMSVKRSCLALMKRVPSLYCETLARYPWAFLILYAMIIVIIISAGFRTIVVNTDIEAFREVAGSGAMVQRSYNEALKFQKAAKNNASLADRKTFELQIFYEAKEGSVFSESSLRDIRSLESLLRNLDGWKKMCALSDETAQFRCEPGESLGNYAWPNRKEVNEGKHTPFTLSFNGESRERLPVHAFLTYLAEGQAAPHDLRKFLPHQFGGPREDSKLLRTSFAFTAPSLDHTAFEEEYKKFVAAELFPALENATARAQETPDDPWIEPWSVKLYFRGEEIEAHEVRYYLHGDLQWAIGALVITLVVTCVQLRSVFLGFLGTTQVCLVPLVAYSVVPVDEVSLATFMCVFLVIGLSTNDLLAVKEYWARVGKECSKDYPVSNGGFGYKDELDRYYAIRLSRTFQQLSFRFTPQLATTCSYLVLLLSLIRPIREFGLFMFACMAFGGVFCAAIFPPLLVVHEAWVQPFIHRRLHRIPATILEPTNLRFPWRPAVRKCLEFAEPRRAKFIWAGTAGVTLIIFIITCVVASNSDAPGLPEVYSPSHHGNAGRPLIDAFTPTSPALAAAGEQALVCDLSSSATCPGKAGLHWCEAPKAVAAVAGAAAASKTPAPVATSNQCVCHREKLNAIGNLLYLNDTILLSGDHFLKASDAIREGALKNYSKAAFPAGQSFDLVGKGKLASSLVLEHWESGLTNVEPVVEMPVMQIKLKSTNDLPSASNTGIARTTCFCGSRVCNIASGFVEASDRINLPFPIVPAAGGRLLAAAESAVASVKEVSIIFGVLASGSDGLLKGETAWSFDASFEPESPWAQRAMRDMCTNIPKSFGVLESHCWIQSFRSWMLEQGEKFPVARFGDFQVHLQRFLREQSSVPVSAMWLDANGDMVATAFAFKIPPKTNAKVTEILADRAGWLGYVGKQNEKAATSASQAWATSSSWAEAEAEHEAMSNAWNIAGLAIGLSIVACFTYTWDFQFVAIVVAIACIALTYLSFFMFCLFGWACGPWEVILLVAYLMYSVEPALRVGRGTVWGVSSMGRSLFLDVVMKLVSGQFGPSSDVVPLPPQFPQLPSIADGGAPAAILDEGGVEGNGVNPDAPASETSSNASPTDNRENAAARSAYLGRMHQFVLNNSNATFGAAVKLVMCGLMILPCEFRLFTRLGAVTILVPLLSLPCVFILLPTAVVLLPIREKPDIVTLMEFARNKFYGYKP